MGGITAEGFDRDTLETILLGIQASELRPVEEGGISPTLDLSTSEPIGQINGTTAGMFAELWELLELCYHGFDALAAEGDLLEAICDLSGTRRKAATKSEALPTAVFSGAATLPAGFLVRIPGDSTRVLELVSTFVQAAPGTATGLLFRATTAGPIAFPAGPLEIVSPVAGLTSISLPSDGETGKARETDDELRLRRSLELQSSGVSTRNALRSKLIKIADIQHVQIFENVYSYTADGMPPHSIEALVYDGPIPTVPNDTIAQVVEDNRGGGVQSYGTEYGSAKDADGNTVRAYFSRPIVKDVYLSLDVATDGTYPTGAAALLKSLLVANVNASLLPGSDVIALAIKASLYDLRKDGYTWLLDVPLLLQDFSPAPASGPNLPVAPREIARLTEANTTINLV